MLRSLSSILQAVLRAVLEIKWVSIKDKTETLVPERSMKQKIDRHSLFCMRKLRHRENQKFPEDSQLYGRSDSDSFTPLLPLRWGTRKKRRGEQGNRVITSHIH